jgi:membrane protease YdiL (CAAX protease family)
MALNTGTQKFDDSAEPSHPLLPSALAKQSPPPRLPRYGRKEKRGTFKPLALGGSDWFTIYGWGRESLPRPSVWWKEAAWVVGGYSATLLLVRTTDSMVGRLCGWDTSPALVTLPVAGKTTDVRPLLVTSLATCVTGPVWEEFFHRGFVLPLLASSVGVPVGSFFSSLLFSAQHLQLECLPQLTVLAGLWTRLYLETGNLLVPIAVHILWNGRMPLVLLLNFIVNVVRR